MSKPKMTMIQIVDETVKFYSKNLGLRGLTEIDGSPSCVYNAGAGKHCAVGRCMMVKFKNKGFDLGGNTACGVNMLPYRNDVKTLDQMLSPKYRGHHPDFWDKLQTNIHDVNFNWDTGGITEQGKKAVKELKEEIKNGEYDLEND